MPDKAKQAKAMVKSMARPVKSISKQLTKIASSTSNSDDTNPKALESKSGSGMVKVSSATLIDDVPLNKKVGKKSSSGSRPTRTKISPAPTTVIGNQELKLKVSHNDAGRVIISLSDPNKVLVQVHVDESVLRTRGGVLKKKTKMSSSSRNLRDDKDRPKKKSSTVTTKKPKKKPSSADIKKKKKKSEPRDLPDEQTSGREKSRSKHGSAKNFTAHFSSMMSVISGQSHESSGSDDSTRSPLDLNRNAVNAPKTPRAQKGFAPEGHTPSTEPDLMDENVPVFDRRRQKMIRQNSRDDFMTAAPGTSGGSPPQMHDQMDAGTEAKVEEGESGELGLFTSPVHQRRMQQRQRRLERQQSAEKNGEAFRSTRSIRSGKRPGRSQSPTRCRHNISDTIEVPPPPAGGPVDPPSMQELDASTNATPASFPTLMDASNTTRNSTNRATHLRHLPPDDDDDDSMTSNSKRGRKKRSSNSKVRNCPAAPKRGSGIFSKQSSYKKIQRRGLKVDEMDEEGLLKYGAPSVSASTNSINTGVSSSNRTGCNLLSMICDKVCNKRIKKEHP